MAIVYSATNKISGKKYIGITKQSLSNRKKGHRHQVRKNKRHPFYDAWRSYGEEVFDWMVLYESESILDVAEKEKTYIEEYDTIAPNGYNLLIGTIIPPNMKGIPKSEEHKRKISEANKGRPKTKEERKRISEGLKGNIPWNKNKKGLQVAWNKGIARSPETIEKIKSTKRKNYLLKLNQINGSRQIAGNFKTD